MPSLKSASPHAAELLAETDIRFDKRWTILDRTDALGMVVAVAALVMAASQITFAAKRDEPTTFTAMKEAQCRTVAASKKVIFEECNGVKQPGRAR